VSRLAIPTSLRQALGNDGIRRLGLSWTLGIAADQALLVVSIVTVFNLGGVFAAGVLGATRMIPAILAGMATSSLLERFRGDRMLVVLGMVRAASAAATATAIFTAGPTLADRDLTVAILFVAAAVAGAAGAPVRPIQATLMPAVARSPGELVAANTVWATGEGLGALGGPFVAGALMGINQHGLVAGLAAAAFLTSSGVAMGLRFEQATDAAGGGRHATGRVRFLDGVQAVLARPVIAWSMLSVYAQSMTRGLMNALVVVAAIQLLNMGQAGAGLLSAALGFGGLLGAAVALTAGRSQRLIPIEILGLVFWGLPLVAIGVAPLAQVALLAMVVIGVSNATYDVALFTIVQRGTPNEDRAPVMSVLEALVGLGAVSGSLLAPALIFVLGPRGALVAAGLILPILAAVMFWRTRHIQRIGVVQEELVELLRRVPAFAELPLTAVERVAAGLVPVSVAAGDALMREGEAGDRFIVVGTGEVEVLVGGQPIHRLGPGAGVGEIALLRRSPRTATVIALTDVTGYSVDAPTFLAAVAGPAAAAVTERMAQANLQRSASRPVAPVRASE
jgi:MFS family permease